MVHDGGVVVRVSEKDGVECARRWGDGQPGSVEGRGVRRTTISMESNQKRGPAVDGDGDSQEPAVRISSNDATLPIDLGRLTDEDDNAPVRACVL